MLASKSKFATKTIVIDYCRGVAATFAPRRKRLANSAPQKLARSCNDSSITYYAIVSYNYGDAESLTPQNKTPT